VIWSFVFQPGDSVREFPGFASFQPCGLFRSGEFGAPASGGYVVRCAMRTTTTTMMIKMMFVVCVLLSWSAASDLPHVLAQSGHIYLTRSLTGRIDCPTDANPAVTRVVWTKDDRAVVVEGASGNGRIRVSRHGALVFRPATSADSGLYTCTPYSRLGKGQPSAPLHLHVKGLTNFALYTVIIDYMLIIIIRIRLLNSCERTQLNTSD